MNTGSIDFEILAKTDAFKRAVLDVQKQLQQTSSVAQREGSKIDGVFRKIGGLAAGYFSFSALKGFGQQIIQVRSQIQSLEVSFRSLLGSEEKANKLLSDIRQYASSTPMQMNDLASAAQTLLGFNIEAEKVMPILKAIGDVSMGNAQKFQSLSLAFAQMSSTGKLMGQDLLQMINAGFNPLVQISETTGKSVAKLKEEMSAGKITVEQVTQAFMDAAGAGGKFDGMLENQSKTIGGAMSNLQGALTDMFNDLGKVIEGPVATTINGLQKIVQNYEKVGKILVTLIATYGGYKAAVMAVTAAEKVATAVTQGYTIAQQIEYKWLLLCEKAQALLNKTMLSNPIVLVAAALTTLISALVLFRDRTSDADRAAQAHETALNSVAEAAEKLKEKTDGLIQTLDDDTLTEHEHKKALDQLKSMYPDLLKDIKTYNDYLEHRKEILEGMPEARQTKGINDQKERIALLERYLKLVKDAQYTGGENYQQHDQRIKRDYGSVPQLYKERDEAKKAIQEIFGEEITEKFKGDVFQFATFTAKQLKQTIADEERDIANAKIEALPIEQRIKLKEDDLKKAENELLWLKKNTNLGKLDIETKKAEEKIAGIKSQIKGLKEEAASSPKKTLSDLVSDIKKAEQELKAQQRKAQQEASESNLKAVDDAQASLDEAKKAYKRATGKEYDDIVKQSQERSRLQKKYQQEALDAAKEYGKKLAQQAVQAQREAEQAEIDAMNDGLAKTIRQNELNYQKRLDALQQESDSMVKELADLKEKEWRAANPDFEKRGLRFDRDSITAADLSEDQQAQLEAKAQQARAERERADEEARQKAIEAIATFEQQRAAIEKEYADKRAALYDENGKLIQGITEQNLQILAEQEEQELQDLLNTLQGSTRGFYQQVLDEERNYAKELENLKELQAQTTDPTSRTALQSSINALIKAHQQATKQLYNTFLKDNIGNVFNDATTENIKQALATLDDIESMTVEQFNEKFNAELTAEQFADLKTEIAGVRKEVKLIDTKNLGQAFKNLFSTDSDIAAKGLQTLQSTLSSVTSTISAVSGALRQLGEAAGSEDLVELADRMDTIAEGLQTAGSYAAIGAQVGGGYGAAIGAVLGVGQTVITKWLTANAERLAQKEQTLAESQQQLSDAIFASVDATNDLTKTITSLDLAGLRQQTLETLQQLKDTNNDPYTRRYGENNHLTLWEYLVRQGELSSASGLQRLQLYDQFDYDQFVRNLTQAQAENERRWNEYEDSLAGWLGWGDQPQLWTEVIQEQIANALNGVAARLSQEKQAVIAELEDLYNHGSTDTIAYYNTLLKAKQVDLEWLQFQKVITNDEQERLNIENEIARQRLEIAQSMQQMVESLWGTDIDSILTQWGDIFQEFGTNSATAFDKIDQSVDQMIANILRQTMFIEPARQRLQRLFESYNPDEGLSQEEAIRLAEEARNLSTQIAEDYQRYLDAVGDSTASLFATATSNTLSGAIRGASQESIDLLAGYTNATRIIQQNQLDLLQQQLSYTASIDGRVAQAVNHLEHIYRHLATPTPSASRAYGTASA